ncbi:FG-GAP repeat domain-containing protein [Streptomyces galbus]|uniref:VCBS repeat-containing protein n=1 Tax=Streptomyces galbus TaxID=33898 RepID=A0ABX1IP76_STRGB|nr:VCBS repeat-containing protein [Streptomyces galbus]NKQ27429.1 VCBS repeat-containing protein [Streptomyces galbus]
MARHTSARLRATAACALLTAALIPLLPAAPAAADTPQETVVPAALSSTYPAVSLWDTGSWFGREGAGRQGVFLHTDDGLVWMRYADAATTKPTRPAGANPALMTGGDAVAYRYPDGRVDLWNAVDGTTRTVRVPAGQTLLGAYDDLVVSYREVTDPNGTRVLRDMHLLFPDPDGTTRDVPVTGVPDGYLLGQVFGGDTDDLLFNAGRPGGGGDYPWVLVDRRTGRVRTWTATSKLYGRAKITDRHVLLYGSGEPTALVYDRTDLSAAPTEVVPDGAGGSPGYLTTVGDWIVRQSGDLKIVAKPLSGGPERTLLTGSYVGFDGLSDGTAVAVGRTSANPDDWGVQRIQAGPDGTPVVTRVKALPKPPLKIQGLSLTGGRLVVGDYLRSDVRRLSQRTVAPTGTPAFGPSTRYSFTANACPDSDPGCAVFHGTGDGRVARVDHGASADSIVVDGPGDSDTWVRGDLPRGGRLTDVSGQYLIYTAGAEQDVFRIGGTGTAALTRAPGPAALSGDTLWTPGPTPGQVTAYDLTAGKTTETVGTGAGCTPTDLQALGRWIYWTCDGQAGVYDRTARTSVPVPADEAELGDGYVVTHDKQAGKLVLTTVADGAPAGRVVGDLPDTGVSQRGVRWTVDESGANLAYVDDREQVHLVPSGVAQQPLRQLGPAQSVTRTSPGTHILTSVLLSKPASGWTLDVRSGATGKHVGGTDGDAVSGVLNVGWDPLGPGSTVSPLPNGTYDWTVTVTPADGVGAPLQVRGTVRMVDGSAVFRDHVGPGAEPDGVGDLLTMPSTGTLTFQQGTGRGTFSGQVSGSGWPSGIRAVPFGDLNGDRCADVLVRLTSGELRLYAPGCGAAVTPRSPHWTVASKGFNQFDVLTSPGDVTKDGRPDLIARNPSTGRVYLYKGTGRPGFAAPVKLYDTWKSYKKIIGAGDLNGDGVGDLLAQDTADNLYRYLGRGNGTFSARVKLFAGWGGSYNAVVGPGDITGDGKADLVARDMAGTLYRQNGTGTGTFGPRVKVGTGWQKYKGLF